MAEQMLSPEDQMMQWITSKWITKPIYVAAELGIADLLQDGPLSIDTLAAKTDTHAPALYRLLRALAAVGVFEEEKDYTFSLRRQRGPRQRGQVFPRQRVRQRGQVLTFDNIKIYKTKGSGLDI